MLKYNFFLFWDYHYLNYAAWTKIKVIKRKITKHVSDNRMLICNKAICDEDNLNICQKWKCPFLPLFYFIEAIISNGTNPDFHFNLMVSHGKVSICIKVNIYNSAEWGTHLMWILFLFIILQLQTIGSSLFTLTLILVLTIFTWAKITCP